MNFLKNSTKKIAFRSFVDEKVDFFVVLFYLVGLSRIL